jgi:chemotaxis signal transduction protein
MIKDSEIPSLPIDGREGLVLFFKVGKYAFGVRLTDVVHIEPLREPKQENVAWAEVVRVYGGSGEEKLPAINLGRFLDIEAANSERERTLVVFRKGEGRFGLIVEEVTAIVPARDAPEIAYPSLLGEEGKNIYDGFFTRGEELVPALNPLNIWSRLES